MARRAWYRSNFFLERHNIWNLLSSLNWVSVMSSSKTVFNPLSVNPTKWSNTFKQFVGKLTTDCLSVFDHFVGLALKGISISSYLQYHLFRFYHRRRKKKSNTSDQSFMKICKNFTNHLTLLENRCKALIPIKQTHCQDTPEENNTDNIDIEDSLAASWLKNSYVINDVRACTYDIST